MSNFVEIERNDCPELYIFVASEIKSSDKKDESSIILCGCVVGFNNWFPQPISPIGPPQINALLNNPEKLNEFNRGSTVLMIFARLSIMITLFKATIQRSDAMVKN